jgi:hypothetical protein
MHVVQVIVAPSLCSSTPGENQCLRSSSLDPEGRTGPRFVRACNSTQPNAVGAKPNGGGNLYLFVLILRPSTTPILYDPSHRINPQRSDILFYTRSLERMTHTLVSMLWCFVLVPFVFLPRWHNANLRCDWQLSASPSRCSSASEMKSLSRPSVPLSNACTSRR